MRRREFITLFGGAAVVWPLAARAQEPGRIRRIGVLMGISNDAEGQSRIQPFQPAMQQLGWAEGRNLQVEYRWTDRDPSLIRTFAKELMDLHPRSSSLTRPPC
jgi:putative ABC transport system substrate-binding protein